MNEQRTYTPAQLALIEQHRHWNVDHGTDWWDTTYDDFVDVAKAFGFDIDKDDIQFSGFWSQGDGASFVFGYVNADDTITAYLKTKESKEYGDLDEATGYVKAFADIGALLLDAFDPYVHTCPEGKLCAQAYAFKNERISHHYSHARTCRVSAEWEYDENNLDGEDEQQLARVANTLTPKVETLRTDLDDAVEAVANALYKTLEEEYDYLTTNDAVWDSLEANDMTNELAVAA